MQHSEVTNLDTDLAAYPLTPDQGATKIYVDSTKADILAALSNADNGVF